MKRNAILAASSLILLAGCQSAGGPNVGQANFTVPVGVERTVHSVYAVNEDCSPMGDVIVRVTVPPQHGTVDVRSGPVHTTFVAANPRSVCNSRTVQGKQIWYGPAAGYSGPDTFAAETIYPNGNDKSETFSINVQ